jgi:SpoVK/Ycf46/Vps4 family AAA+-type ATPase
MARADLLLDLVRAGARGDQPLFRKAVEALISEERARQHHILADRLAAHLQTNGGPNTTPLSTPLRRDSPTGDLYYETAPERRLEDLLVPEIVEKAGRELIEEHRRTDLLRAYSLEPRHRVLLAGPPGNGKTSLAEALATELAVPLLIVRYESVIASYLGETAVRLTRLFQQVRTRRCVLFFDEFDVVGKERGDVHETGEIKRVVSSLLLQIDDLPSHVVVITATNHPELLDRAVWRRFQLRLDLPPPTPALAQEWFARFEERFGIKLGYAPAILAQRLKGLSFSELEEFSLDVQRQYVLHLPCADIRRIVDERLKQWQHRFTSDEAESLADGKRRNA